MAGLGNALTTLLITDGLFIGDGITSVFDFGSLLRISIGGGPQVQPHEPDDDSGQSSPPSFPSLTVAGNGSGGSGGGALGIGQQHNVIPLDQEAKYFKRNNLIKVQINIAGKSINKTFTVSQSRTRTVFKVINLMNDTKKQLNASVKNIKHVASMSIARVRNLRLVRKNGK